MSVSLRNPLLPALMLGLVLLGEPVRAEAIIADHASVGQFDQIPMSVIEAIHDNYNYHYTHTSHGSQIMTGIDMVYDENPAYDPPYFYERGDDLGYAGDTTWAPPIRTYLDAHPECNMVMLSWCGGMSSQTESGVNLYLSKMTELEGDYPGVTFVYMTGHLDGSGPDGNLYVRNNQVRAYCQANDKVLFDFADIESYDPDGTWYPDDNDGCDWCDDWCAAHSCPACGSCAHSHCFNCYLKGKAWWWMMARLEGWNGELQAPVLQHIGDRFAQPAETCVITVSATDGDGQIDSITAAPLPSGASFTYQGNGQGLFEWTPQTGDLGNHDVVFTAYDNDDLTDWEEITITVSDECCIPPMRGDINVDGASGEVGIDVEDLVYLVNYMFKQGAEPPCWDEANVNGEGGDKSVDIADLVHLVNYMFKSGPEPVACP